MNNDTIKAADDFAFEAGDMRNNQKAFIAGAQYMQAQKDEQIKELVEALERAMQVDKVSDHKLSIATWCLFNELIQKYKG